jgi:hypothetical protein
MVNLQSKIPPFVNEKRNIASLILFTAAFALVFINFYEPFGVRYFNVSSWQLFLYSSLITLTGVMVVVISRMLMFVVCKKRSISYWSYFVWVLAEVAFMALFYSLFEKIFLNDGRDFLYLFKFSVQNTALVLLLPYSAMWLYFSYREKKERLERLEQSDAPVDSTKNMVTFHDEKGILRISIKQENILYIESFDNYVNIYYLNKGQISKFLLRNTLKRMEELLKDLPMVRCHRSFMVNFDKVKVIRKEKDGLLLELDQQGVSDIPVSKTYVENVMTTFTRYSQSSLQS